MKRVAIIIMSTLMLMGCTSTMNKRAEMYVNGVLVDDQMVSFERINHSEIIVLIPVVRLFESIGYAVIWVDDYTAEIEMGDSCILLDVKNHRIDVDDGENNWDVLTLMPGDREEDFVVREEDHELLVCADYVQSAFELLYIDMQISVDQNNKRVFITSNRNCTS
ncbi:MAG: hypothetical protein IJH64_07360 [Oscillospiraceae bacterium]|nr:hypothetical protein [Oscillospiraceae bacterium]